MLQRMRLLGVLIGTVCCLAIGLAQSTTEPVPDNHIPPAEQVARENAASPPLAFPIIPRHGGVMPRPQAVEQPRAATKVVFDVTADAQPTAINKGLERVARLLNLYGAAGLQPGDVKIAVVVHGDATLAILSDPAYQSRLQVGPNPNLPLLRELQQAGVEILVCGQALNYKGIPDTEVAADLPIAVSALTAVINKQTDGYACIPIP